MWDKGQGDPGVNRGSYRAVLRADACEAEVADAFMECRASMENAKRERKVLTASLYRYGGFLFLYTEGAGEAVNPAELLSPLCKFLQLWPAGVEAPDTARQWVYMQPYFYHAVPGRAEDWMEHRTPCRRRGRIALLTPGKWEEYMAHHFFLMREGLIEGDRYHFISVHENVLFSYFEEPKTITNLQGKSGCRSTALDSWMKTDPESHFMRFAPGQGAGPEQNFVFLPCCASV